MAQTVNVIVCPEDRERLLAIIGDRNRPFKQIQRAKIVLFSAERLPVLEVARRAGASRPAVWRWQRRYGEQGVDGLLRDKTRKPGRTPLSAKVVAKVLELTCSEPPGEVTHWTGRAMAKAAGISLRAVQRLWEAHRLQPHRIRTFKRSNDPEFAEKVEDVVGLYMGECQKSCVRGRFSHHALTNLSSNMMANWVLASHHSRGGIFHVCATWRKTRYSNLIAASSVGKWPLVRTARRSLAFKDSMAFVV